MRFLRTISTITCAFLLMSASAAMAQVVRVTVRAPECNAQSCRYYLYHGTGFVVAKDKETMLVLTAAHNVRDLGPAGATEAEELNRKGCSITVGGNLTSRVIRYDPKQDIALLSVNGTVASGILEISEPKIGASGMICGYGPGDYKQISGAILGSNTIDAKARLGDSGGPIVQDGRCVGMVVVTAKYERTSYFVTAAQLQEFIDPYVIITKRTPEQPKQSKTSCKCGNHGCKCADSECSCDQSTRSAPHSPKLPSGECGCDGDIAAMKLQIEELKTELRKRPTVIQGPPGIPGRDGKDAALLPLTVTLNTVDDTGKVTGTTTKTYKPGEPIILNFKPIQSANQ